MLASSWILTPLPLKGTDLVPGGTILCSDGWFVVCKSFGMCANVFRDVIKGLSIDSVSGMGDKLLPGDMYIVLTCLCLNMVLLWLRRVAWLGLRL